MVNKTRKINEKLKCSKEEENVLVNFVKNHSFMWDVSNKDYKNTFKKELAWKELAQLMGGKDVDQLKKRWRNMRVYEKSKKKRSSQRAKKSTGSGRTSEDEMNEFEAVSDQVDNNNGNMDEDNSMSFLDESSTQRNTVGNFDDIILKIIPADSDSLFNDNITKEGNNIDTGSETVTQQVDMEFTTTSSQQSPFPLIPKPNKRKKQPKDDLYISIMQEKTKVLNKLASTSDALKDAYDRECNTNKSITQKYFDVYAAEIELLPIELKSKCQREVQQAVTTIIHKYQDQAEKIRNSGIQSNALI